MSMFRVLFSAVVALQVFGSQAIAHGYKLKTIEIVHPWTFASESGTRTVTVCMIIKSLTQQGDRLRGATTSIASKVELHRGMRGGAPGAARVTPMFEIEGRRTLEMSQSGDRLILHDVTKELWAYDTFPMTLNFERAGRVEIEVMVEEAPATRGGPAN